MVKILFLVLSFLFSASEIKADVLADTVEKLKPAIVAVGTFMPKRAPRAVFRGTGFAIADGSLVATNAHVIPEHLATENMEKIAVFIKRNGKDTMYLTTVVAIDKEHDVAVLKLTEGRLSPLVLDMDLNVREGDLFAFTGYPIGMVLGLYPATHTGIVSAITPVAIPMINARQLNAKVMKRLRHPYKVYQMDAIAYPGNSGSPLFHPVTGKVVGIINSVFVKESKETILSRPSGISYAIPVKYLEKILSNYKSSL